MGKRVTYGYKNGLHIQSMEKGIVHLVNSSRRLSGAAPVQGKDTGLARDGGDPQ